MDAYLFLFQRSRATDGNLIQTTPAKLKYIFNNNKLVLFYFAILIFYLSNVI